MLVVTMAMMTTTLAKHTNEADNGDCEGDNDGDNDGEDDGDEDGNGCNRDDETNVDDVGVFKAFEDACSGWVGGRAIWAWGGSLRIWRTSRCRQIIAHVAFCIPNINKTKRAASSQSANPERDTSAKSHKVALRAAPEQAARKRPRRVRQRDTAGRRARRPPDNNALLPQIAKTV
jgi:hypothetical protein